MYQPIQLTNTIPAVRNSLSRAIAGRGFLLLPFAIAQFALSPAARAVTPAPDGGYLGGNTAEGKNALLNLVIGSTTGINNTAIGAEALLFNTDGVSNTATGFQALLNNTTGGFNTATGTGALSSNTTGNDNTATGVSALSGNTTGLGNTANGFEALLFNSTGGENTATGSFALFNNTTGGLNTASGADALLSNTTGNLNTATGINALFSNTTGGDNTATGGGALSSNTTGNDNTATGVSALLSNTTGGNNTAAGFNALSSNTTGSNNTAEGFQALFHNTTGSNNIAVGANGGFNLTIGSNNIDIGASGVAGEFNTIRIGKVGVQKAAYVQGISGATVASGATVIVGSDGHLGTVVSSERFKEAIQPMDKASEAILALQPVTFRYKHELDPEGIPQFGLVAEQVEKVNPDLVVRDSDGKVNTVRYEAVNAMLLNEFLKEHHKVEELEATVAQERQESQAQRKEIKNLTATLKEQAAQIQKVSDRVELSQPTPQMAANNQ